jgi:hypothetical protein
MSIVTDTQFLLQLSPRLEKFKKVRDYLWNFRCPHCGDSSKNKNKARGYVYRKKTDLFFKCHNCSVGQSVGNLIKELDPSLHKFYVMERWKDGQKTNQYSKLNFKPENVKFKFKAPKFKPKKTVINLPSIESLPEEHYARVYCEHRLIPEKHMKDFFFAEDFKNWALSVCKLDYSTLRPREPRLVIPFFDKANQLIGAQGRALNDSKVKYVTIKVHEDSPKVFGLERLDSEKPTYLVEGPIDSLFLPNCLAMAGADMRELDMLDKSNTTIIYDNEPRNPQIVQRTLDALKKGWKVVVWPDSVITKDINDMVLSSIKDARLVKIINRNTYSGQLGEWEVKRWKQSR